LATSSCTIPLEECASYPVLILVPRVVLVPANAVIDDICVAIVYVFSRLLNPADQSILGVDPPEQNLTMGCCAVFMGNTDTGCRRVWMVDGTYRQCLARRACGPCTDSSSIDLDNIGNAHYSKTSFSVALSVFRHSSWRQPDTQVTGFYG